MKGKYAPLSNDSIVEGFIQLRDRIDNLANLCLTLEARICLLEREKIKEVEEK